ncbi:hypothetical protein O9Z70_14210 [Devosia sp. YIM 151766]|uniref:hypothetical protein n=1 Tax=Devosia sp. YIM 151766 TaxID=3017325 RepID=UPI00255D0DEA|nr:hypothetical protein [Devosia sp. YIM 151766]WIY52592.1 hypothetical protein O9Z70_14210 [Devosia sp. YIM 151766]
MSDRIGVQHGQMREIVPAFGEHIGRLVFDGVDGLVPRQDVPGTGARISAPGEELSGTISLAVRRAN